MIILVHVHSFLPCRFALVNDQPVFYSYVVTARIALLSISVGFSSSALAVRVPSQNKKFFRLEHTGAILPDIL